MSEPDTRARCRAGPPHRQVPAASRLDAKQRRGAPHRDGIAELVARTPPAGTAARRAGAGRRASLRSSPRSGPTGGSGHGCGPNPTASSAGVQPRGSSSSASGLPRVSATMESLTRTSSGCPRSSTASKRARVRVRRRPSTDELGEARPARPRCVVGWRTAAPTELGQQATGDEARAPGLTRRSSNCASSIDTQQRARLRRRRTTD